MTDGLLLLHAWPLDARMWDPQIAGLPPGLALAAPDHPGFGGTGLAGEETTMAACAERAIGALDAAGIDRALVCGLSMGGYVAFELWRRARARVAGLVLANTRAVADTPEAAQARRSLAARLRTQGNVLLEEPPALLSPDAPRELHDRVLALMADQSPGAIAAGALGMASRPDSTADLAGIDVPTLVVTSAGDRLIPPEVSADMAQRIPGARFEVVERVGHLSNLEAPDEFDRLLAEHLVACGLG